MPVFGSRCSLARVSSEGSDLVDHARACRIFLQLALAAIMSESRPLVLI